MRIATLIAAAATFTASTASAQYTWVNSSGSEASHADILASALGGSFNSVGSRDYSNGPIYADRMRDRGWGDTDRYWDAGTYKAEVIGKEAGFSHTFGAVEGSFGGGNLDQYQALLDSSAIGSEATVTMNQDFRWAIDVDSGGQSRWNDQLYTSRRWDNASGRDHMVSYKLFNNGDLFGYALFFEDIAYCSDKDYNDVAVLLTLVPTPQAAMLGLTGLGGLGLMTGRRRRSM